LFSLNQIVSFWSVFVSFWLAFLWKKRRNFAAKLEASGSLHNSSSVWKSEPGGQARDGSG
jgi:hypothetical protein